MDKHTHIQIGAVIRFGASRRMEVTAAVPYGTGHVVQKLTLRGARGGIATAFVFADGRIRLQ